MTVFLDSTGGLGSAASNNVLHRHISSLSEAGPAGDGRKPGPAVE